MDFADNKLTSFTKKIIDLIDQPNMQPNELKAYFDSSPEEVRQAHNGLCDALTTATSAATAAANLGFQTTAGVPADNVQDAIEDVQAQLTDAVLGNIPSGSVTNDKLAQEVRDHFTTIENSVTTEASARAGGDSNLQNQINTHTSQLNSHATQIAAKCEIYFITFEGDDTSNRLITLGYRPKVVIVTSSSGLGHYSGMGVDISSMTNGPVIITDQGFKVSFSNYSSNVNQSGVQYFCLILK